MIELRLTGTVEVEQDYSERGTDGKADYAVENTIRRTIEVDARKQFPDGYVNLEGYVLSRHWTTEYDSLHSFAVPENPALEDWRILEDSVDLTVEMNGGAWDWVEQAAKYVTERPNLSVIGALEKFRSWDETDSDTLDSAIINAEGVENADVDIGGLDGRAYNIMLNQLSNHSKRDNARVDITQFKNDDVEV